RRDVIGMFNWDGRDRQINYSLERLGLEGGTEYVAFDFWQNALVPALKDRLQCALPGESCRVLAVRPRSNHPQLISTSRHVSQGIIDVTDEKWSGKTLSGRSQLIAGDPYELRVVAPDKSWNVESVKVSGGADASFTQSDELARATIKSDKGGEVSWEVKFR